MEAVNLTTGHLVLNSQGTAGLYFRGRGLGADGMVITSAGLWIGQSDEEEMGFTYAQLERYLDEGPQGVSPAIAMKIERLIRSSEHKRALPPIPEL